MSSLLKTVLVAGFCVAMFGSNAASSTAPARAVEHVDFVVDDPRPDDPHPIPITDPHLCSICHGSGSGGFSADEFTSFDSMSEELLNAR